MAWHAKLSASTAKRWINCPGSIAAIEALYAEHPELKEKDEASPFAREGTAAHHLLEHCVAPLEGVVKLVETSQGTATAAAIDPRSLIGAEIKEDGTIIPYEWVTKRDPRSHEVTEDMAEAVGVAVDFVEEELNRLGPGTEFYSERKWDLTWLHPDLGGTSDLTLSQFLVELVVLDYKHGKGVVVEVMDDDGHLNEQGMCYLLGAARVDNFSHETYKIGIIQPRALHQDGGVRCSQPITRAELIEFQQMLLDAANETAKPNAVLRAGDWCRFCPKSGNCPAQDERAEELAGADFDDLPLEGQTLDVQDGPTVDVHALARKLRWIPLIDAWARGVEAMAQRLAETGESIPDHKLVQKKTNRKLRDVQELVAAAEKAGLDPLKLFNEPKPKSPAQVEKLGREYKLLVNQVGDDKEPIYWFKPQGKITLAPESDRRPAVEASAIADFAAIEDDDGDD